MKCVGLLVKGLFCWLLVGCSTSSGNGAPPGGPKAFGEACQKTEDCASQLCVRLDEFGGICSQACSGPQDCPSSDNWGCLAAPQQSFSVCACEKLAPHEVCGDGIDNDCDGKVDDCRICDGRAVPNDDHANCGACGRACRDDQSCEGGSCKCSDDKPDECAGVCVALKEDAANCGACGVACPFPQKCQNGSCACADATLPDFCDGSGCVDEQTDTNHCGDCKTTCGLGQQCSKGSCVCPAGGPQDFCDGVGCIDTQSDAKNCGKCGAACVADQVCSAGKCSCPNGKLLCGGTCVDAQNDKANCGDCGNACPNAQACLNGKCGCNDAQLSVCGDGCANLQNDPQNCGKCGSACAAGEACTNGVCRCQSGLYCDAICEPKNDDSNCGACGNACSAAQYCNSGICQCQGFGLTKCGDACYDLYTDEQHCGSCDNACHSGETCSSGQCTCPYGETYCESAGKCVSLSDDESNCGTCGHACNATEQCGNGQCACPTTGQQYCAAVGKCVDTQSNAQRCGSCDTVCKPTQVCSYGECGCSGYSEQFCQKANACVDLWTDSKNCGACDKVCPAKTHCAGASCACDTAGQTLCGMACYDLQTNAKNCGACGKNCGGSYICSAGQCQCPDPTVGTAVRLTNDSVNQFAPAAAWDGTHVGVAYLQQITGAYANLHFALLNPDGTLVKDIALTSYAAGDFKSAGNIDRSDRLGLTWNGSEYGLVYDDMDVNTSAEVVRLVRITPAGVASAPVTVVTSAVLSNPVGPSIGWSVPYGGYLISGSVWGQVYYRRIGAKGTSLEAPNTYSGDYNCNSSIAVAPDGRATVACNPSLYGTVAFFEADGSRTRPVGGLNVAQPGTDTESIWDGTTFSSAVPEYGSGVHLFRDGSTAPWFELVPYKSGVSQSAVELVGLGTSLALGSVAGGIYQLDRFTLPANLDTAPTKIHGQVSIVATPNVQSKPELVQAGAGKLLAIWPDNRWGNTAELYAAPIDLKACP